MTKCVLLGVLIGALGMLLVLALIARARRPNRKTAANSVVHAKENVVAIVKSAGGEKREIRSK